ncbi:hypothetical protein ACFXNW_18725 [Nocardia sp. NPDC059180]|uniref:hypothetical protein n=1 Tax=Nocardia sp. NPDC059180 TaxID=3346761 RepID=UPI00367B0CDC
MLTDHKARTSVAVNDIDPVSGRARCRSGGRPSCSRNTPPSSTAAPTLRQLRHSRLTHAAEEGASTPVLMTLPVHTSVRSLAEYARVSDEGLRRLQADSWMTSRRQWWPTSAGPKVFGLATADVRLA